MSSVLVFSRRSNNQLTEGQRTGQPERGDVVDIAACDDMHWGNKVMGPAALGWWQVIVVPNAGLRELGALLQASPEVHKGWAVWRHRLWRLDLDALGKDQLAGTWVVPLERLLAHAAPKRISTGLVLG